MAALGSEAPNEFSGRAARWGAVPRIIHAVMALPGARVDRAEFLRSQLHVHFNEEQVRKAIESGPASAGIPIDQIDSIADSVIGSHTVKAAGISFATGLPGGWFMAATIPTDLVNYFWHATVVAQKLAYLYGWPDLLDEGDLDEETELRIVLLLGAMFGAGQANNLLAEIAKRFAGEATRRLPRYALTKTTYYPLVKTVLKWVGQKVTKQSFARAVSKAIPVLGGVLSAGVTTITFLPMSLHLKNHLRTLRYALPELGEGTPNQENVDTEASEHLEYPDDLELTEGFSNELQASLKAVDGGSETRSAEEVAQRLGLSW